jgi:adenine phosphoribosyltransferase
MKFWMVRAGAIVLCSITTFRILTHRQPVHSSSYNCNPSPCSPTMSGKPVSFDSHPPHGHPENQGPSTQNVDRASTASHPPSIKPDPTTTAPHPKLNPHGAKGSESSSSASGPAELSDLKVRLRNALRQYPDFPSKGILFEDIMPIFSSPKLHADLVKALELEVRAKFDKTPDVIVGLESRGFLFGPSLALRLDAGFVPIRKQGKLPGKLETEGYEKEYGTDFFQIQSDAIAKGQTVLVVDDIMATGTLSRSYSTRLAMFSN